MQNTYEVDAEELCPFICTVCDSAGAERYQHARHHALVRCQPIPSQPDTQSVDRRLNAISARQESLETKISALEGKIENHQKTVEAQLQSIIHLLQTNAGITV